MASAKSRFRDFIWQALTRPIYRNTGLAIAFAALAFLLWHSDDPATVNTAAIELRGSAEPDTFVNDGTYRSFDELGQLEVIISSPRIEQFDDRPDATMVAPDATLLDQETGTQWHVTADHGLFHQTNEILDLNDNVRVTRPVAGGKAVLLTEYLRVDNPARKVVTDHPVTIESPGTVTQGTGMEGWIDERIVELETNVKGIYETRP